MALKASLHTRDGLMITVIIYGTKCTIVSGLLLSRFMQKTHQLTQSEDGFSMRVEASAHARFLNKTMRYPVAGYEDNYVVGLDVFHQLHCLVSNFTDLMTTEEL
jgi:hypothetical protein